MQYDLNLVGGDEFAAARLVFREQERLGAGQRRALLTRVTGEARQVDEAGFGVADAGADEESERQRGAQGEERDAGRPE